MMNGVHENHVDDDEEEKEKAAKVDEDLRLAVEKQNETLKKQQLEFEDLRKKLEENARVTEDFRAELSEIRKNWQNLGKRKRLVCNVSGILRKSRNIKILEFESSSKFYTICPKITGSTTNSFELVQ